MREETTGKGDPMRDPGVSEQLILIAIIANQP